MPDKLTICVQTATTAIVCMVPVDMRIFDGDKADPPRTKGAS